MTITKANALAELPGNEVFLVLSENCDKQCTTVQPISEKVHLVFLGINYFEGDCGRSKFANLFVYASKRIKHRKRLYEALKNLKPDIVISVGLSERYMVLSMPKRSWKVIREYHFERNYRRKEKKSKFDQFVARISDFYGTTFIEKKFDKIIVLTDEDKNLNWRGWSNVDVIPNPISFTCDEISSLSNKSVISLGRLVPQKNFSSLLRAFQIVRDVHPDWTLKIYGDGPERESLLNMIEQLKLVDNVQLMGISRNVSRVLKDASFLVVSSIYEGFSLVIVEAMECGLPVVSYQCPCGPKDIISDGVDGFLVPVGNEQMMADRICTLIEDEELRRKMGASAKEKAKKYHIDNITKLWMNLFEELVKK